MQKRAPQITFTTILHILFFTHANANICNDYSSKIIKTTIVQQLEEIAKDYINIQKCSGSSARFYYKLGKQFYEIGSFKNAKKYLTAAREYSKNQDKFYSNIHYYLVLVALEQTDINIEYIKSLIQPLWERPKPMQKKIITKLKAKYKKKFLRFKNNPIKNKLPEDFIQLSNIFNLAQQLGILDILIKGAIPFHEKKAQSKQQAVNLKILYQRLKQFNKNYDDKIFQYNSLIDYYDLMNKADSAAAEDKCELYSSAYKSLQNALDKEDTELSYCKKEVICLDMDVKKSFIKRFQSIEKYELSLKTKWKQDFHEISEKCQTAIPDLFTRLQTHLDIYKSFTSAIHKLSIAEFSKFYNQYKSLPLIIQTNDKLISTFIHACAKYNMIQLTKRVPNNQSIVECRDCAWDIHQKLKDTKKDFLKNKYFSQASVDEAFNRPIKQSEYLFNFLQYLYKGDDEQNGNKVKKIIKQLEPEIRSAWHLNNLISQKRVCYLTVNSPLSITYNFEGYQIEAIPDLGDKPTPCKIYDKSKCKIELPDNVGCQLRFLSDPREITRIKGVRNKTNNEEKITVPKTLFKEICITENINNAAVFKLYPIKHFDGTPNYITHCNFNSPRKCLDILPGDYVYTLISVPQKNLDCSSSGMLNKWFESITVHDNNEIVIELFKNQMKTKNKADSYLNKCMKRIKSKKFGERQKKEYLDHTKGNVCFFKYFLPWYCKQYSEPLIWQNLVEPVTRCSDYKWFRHYRIPQLQQLGVDTSSNNNKLLCHLFYTQLDLISNKKPQHLEIAQNRQMYLNLLKKVVVVHEIYKKLERYADYVYEDE